MSFMKFGGSSLESAGAIQRVASIVRDHRDRQPDCAARSAIRKLARLRADRVAKFQGSEDTGHCPAIADQEWASFPVSRFFQPLIDSRLRLGHRPN
jgi:hypothetical protein